MAASKRLRFEILRRDNHACRYCGGTAPDVALTVDHILPVALGGTDDPTNLVAACRDCNAGKASINPDQPIVDDVAQDAIRWRRALTVAAQRAVSDEAEQDKLNDQLFALWEDSMPQWAALPNDFPQKFTTFRSRGLPQDAIAQAIWIASAAGHVPQRSRWNYFCGICWKKISELEATARALLTEGAVD